MLSLATTWKTLQTDPTVSLQACEVTGSELHRGSCSDGFIWLQALESLRVLALNRHVLSAITSSHAGSILLVLKHLWEQKHISGAARLTAFSQAFQLLAKWAHAFRLNTPTSAAERKQLLEATASALQLLLSPWCTAQACAACILFLGVACQGKFLHTAFQSSKSHCCMHSACTLCRQHAVMADSVMSAATNAHRCLTSPCLQGWRWISGRVLLRLPASPSKLTKLNSGAAVTSLSSQPALQIWSSACRCSSSNNILCVYF